jgi:hypothetical protein
MTAQFVQFVSIPLKFSFCISRGTVDHIPLDIESSPLTGVTDSGVPLKPRKVIRLEPYADPGEMQVE